jgi:hypothetical protein
MCCVGCTTFPGHGTEGWSRVDPVVWGGRDPAYAWDDQQKDGARGGALLLGHLEAGARARPAERIGDRPKRAVLAACGDASSQAIAAVMHARRTSCAIVRVDGDGRVHAACELIRSGAARSCLVSFHVRRVLRDQSKSSRPH